MSAQRFRAWIESIFYGDPFERLVVAIITTVTVLAAVVTWLQTDASAYASQAGRDAQGYAIQAMGRRVTGQAKIDYAQYAHQVYEELDVQALLAERNEDPTAAAREVLSGETAAPLVEPAPPPTQVRATPTPKSAQPAVPAGKGGLVMFNCRGDVVTVDVIPDAIFQELAPKTGDQCHRGEPIYLDPGEHILKASIAGVPSHGEATITIVEGQWFEFTWY